MKVGELIKFKYDVNPSACQVFLITGITIDNQKPAMAHLLRLDGVILSTELSGLMTGYEVMSGA